MNYQEALTAGSKHLKKNHIKNPRLDSEILLSKVLKINREKLLLNLEKKINNINLLNYNKLISRRKKKEPIAYIVGHKEFWKQKFKVNKNVLIPRPDTEVLIEQTLKFINKNNSIRILDVGTGSGCIILSILAERENCYGIAIDISKKALNVAKYNAKIQQFSNRVKFINSDIDNFFFGKYDLIISNPPYIKNYKINYLEEDVKLYEPNLALNGGTNGFAKIKKIVKRSKNLIKTRGKLILEIGSEQSYHVKEILKKNGFYINKIIKDLSHNNRCIISTKI